MVWSDLVTPGVPLIEKIVRPLIVYVALLLLLRLFGKRELAQLNQYDLIVLLTISNTVQNAIIGNDNSVTGGLVGAITLLFANYVVVRFLYRHERIDRLVEGNAATLIENGRVLKDRLDAELITLAELEAAAHRQGFESLESVDHAVLEPGGTLTCFGRKPSDDTRRQQDVMAQLEEIKQLLRARAPS
jgi:uncharacterized membrane protein YcaP (DUF421 family)